ncbi:hypothetical protein HPP92_029153 [Vanilla planifolia]|uniref:Uncharacterized protein n=1 Tax=Vanilla planifolia TaxID=51239 RepID=A0A835P3D8_VANPL|nr:hypothetical protein HPP92_029153 [Vanilla planifolia]KAG0445831.1 hypothetical protein HPP92_029142 [Vanilla planifolia]
MGSGRSGGGGEEGRRGRNCVVLVTRIRAGIRAELRDALWGERAGVRGCHRRLRVEEALCGRVRVAEISGMKGGPFANGLQQVRKGLHGSSRSNYNEEERRHTLLPSEVKVE